MLKVKFKKVTDTAITPTKGSAKAAAFDLYLAENCYIPAHTRVIGKTGIAMQLPEGYCADVRPRSGFSAKGMEGFPTKGPEETQRFDADVILGTVDEDYNKEIGVIISSHDDRSFYITKGTRVAQLFIHPYEPQVGLFQVEDISDTGRGGFGSTGSH